jgi:hypothetical protein
VKFLSILLAVACATSMARAQTEPFRVLLNLRDQVSYFNEGKVFKYTCQKVRDVRSLRYHYVVITSDLTPDYPTTITLGNGHSLLLGRNTKVEAIDEDPDVPGIAFRLYYGQVTIADVSPQALKHYRTNAPTRVVVKTKGSTAGAKGTLVMVSYSPNRTKVVNLETSTLGSCEIYRRTKDGGPTELSSRQEVKINHINDNEDFAKPGASQALPNAVPIKPDEFESRALPSRRSR